MSSMQQDAVSRRASRPHHIWWRVAALLCLVFAIMLALEAFLNFSNYRKTYLNLNLTRHLVLVKDLRQTVEAGMNIGLLPASNVNLQPALERVVVRHPGVSYVAIADDTGHMVGTGALPPLSSAAWRALLDKSPLDTHWQTSSDDLVQLGMPYSNSFNGKAGVIVIGYQRAPLELAISQMRTRLLLDYLTTVTLAAGCIVAAVLFLTRHHAAELERLTGVIEAALAPSAKDRPSASLAALAGNEVAAEVDEFVVISREAAQALDAAAQQLSTATPAGGRP